MKVVVSCDAIVGRDYYVEIIESVLDVVGNQCELYTIVHNQGAVLGPVEERKIHSTFLSHKVKSYSQLLENSFLIPNACKNLFIPCSVDLIINISRGFSHGIKKCENTKMISFIVEDLFALSKKSFMQKIFSSLIKSYQKKSLNNVDVLWTTDINLIPASLRPVAQIVNIPVKLTDYKILPDALFNRDYFLINSEAIDTEMALSLINEFKGQKFKFIGKDDHLSSVKFENEVLFFGDRCGGELAPLLGGAKFLIDHETNSLPVYSLRMLASGRGVYSNNKYIANQEGVFNLSLYKDLCVSEFDKNKARGVALAFEELKFKHRLKKELETLNFN